MPNGVEVDSVAAYRKELLEQSDRFLRGVTEKMFVYALGRTVEPSDRATVEDLVAEMKANDETFRALIKTIVKSEAFRSK